MLKIFHFLHDESKMPWEYESIEENKQGDFLIATWKVICKCGAVKYRRRAYQKYKGHGKKYIFEHTLEEAIGLAKLSKGDNYHV